MKISDRATGWNLIGDCFWALIQLVLTNIMFKSLCVSEADHTAACLFAVSGTALVLMPLLSPACLEDVSHKTTSRLFPNLHLWVTCVFVCFPTTFLRKQGPQGYLKVTDFVEVFVFSSTFHICQVWCVRPWLCVEIIHFPALFDKCCLVITHFPTNKAALFPNCASRLCWVILWADKSGAESANGFV